MITINQSINQSMPLIKRKVVRAEVPSSVGKCAIGFLHLESQV